MLLISTLSRGGAERVATQLANYWFGLGWDISVVTIGGSMQDFYVLASGVKRYDLDLNADSSGVLEALVNNWRRVVALRKLLRTLNSDAAIAFGSSVNILTLLASRGLDLRVIVSERSDPEHDQIGKAWSGLRRFSYPWARAVVMQTQKTAGWMRRNIARARVVVVANPVPPDLLVMPPRPAVAVGRKRLIAMGRLSREKGFDLLLRAFAGLSRTLTDWDLWIWGEGPERHGLEALVTELSLDGRVFLPGATRRPWDELAGAELFVLSSHFEGFPNVLLEAMALGRPCVAFDCPSGPREMSRDGNDAALVAPGDVIGLQQRLRELMADEKLRARFGSAASSVRQRFAIEKVHEAWESLICG